MDFHTMNRRELQELCKNHGIPANLSTAEMAARLASSVEEVEKEKPSTGGRGRGRGRSCLKEVEQDLVSDGENRKAKKVRFSPENELIEFTKSIATRGCGKKLAKRNSSSTVGNVCRGEVKQAIPKTAMSIPSRVTRSRGLQLWDVGDDGNKVTKRGLSCDDRVEEVSSLSDNEVREPTRRALRKRELQDEELDKEVGDIQGLRMSSRKRTRGSAKGIANVPQSQQSIKELQSPFRRSVRNAALKENTGLVNEVVGKNEKYNVDALVVETDEDKSVENVAELVTSVGKKAGVVTRRSSRNREVMVEGRIVREDDNERLRSGRHIKKGLLVNNQALQTQDIVEEPKKGFLRKSKRNVSQGKDTVPLDGKNIVNVRSLRNREITVEKKTERDDDNAGLRGGRHLKQGILLNNEAVPSQNIVEEPKKKLLRKSKRNVSQGKDTVTPDGDKNNGKVRSLRNRVITVEENIEREDDKAELRTERHIKQAPGVSNKVLQTQDIVEEPNKESVRKSKRSISHEVNVTLDGHKSIGKARSLRNREITVEENTEGDDDNGGLRSGKHIKQGPLFNNEVIQTQDIVEEHKESMRKSKKSISHEDKAVTPDVQKSSVKVRSLRNRDITVEENTEREDDNAGLRSGKHIKQGPLVNNEVIQTPDIVEEHKKESMRKSKKSISHEDTAVTLDVHKSSVKVRSLRNRDITVKENTEGEDDNAGLRSEKHIKQGPLVNNEVMQTQDIVKEHKKESLSKSKRSISHEDNAVTLDGHKSIGKVRSLRNREITVEEKTKREDDDAGLRSGRHIKQGPLVDNDVLQAQETLEEPKKELLRSKGNVSYGDNTATTSGNKNIGKVRQRRNHISLALNTSNSKFESTAAKAAADSSVFTTASEDINKELMKMGGQVTERNMEPLEEGPQKGLIGDEVNKTMRSKRNSAKMDEPEYLHIGANSEFTSKSSEHDQSVAEDMETSRRNSGHNHVNSCDRTERIHSPIANHAVEKESCVKHPSVEISSEQLKANAARYSKSVPSLGNEQDAGNKNPANPDCLIDEFSLEKNEPEGNHQKSQVSPHKSGNSAGEVEEVNTPHFDTGVENSCSDLVDLHIENEVQTMSIPITESHGFEEMGNSPMKVNVENPLDDLVASFAEQEPSAYFNVDRDSASVEANSRVDMHTSNGQSYSTGGVKEMLREELIKDDHEESESKEVISAENEFVLDAAPLDRIDGVNLATKFSLTEDTKSNNNKFLHIGEGSQVNYILNEPVNLESSIHNTAMSHMTGSKLEESSQQHNLASSLKVDSRKSMEVQSPRLVSAAVESCSEVATPHFDHVEHEKAIVNELKDLSDIANIPSEENTHKSLEGLIGDNLFHCKTHDGINVTRDAVASEISSSTNALGCIAQPDVTADLKEGQSKGVAEFQHAGSLSKHKDSTSQDEQTVKDEQEPSTIAAESVSSFATVTVYNDLLQDTLDDRPADNSEIFIHNTAMTGNKFEESSQQHKLVSSPKVDSRKKMEVQSPQFERAVEEPCSVVVTSQFDHVEHPKVIGSELKDFSYIVNIHSEENTYNSLEGGVGDTFHCKTYDDINVARDAGTSEINYPTNVIGCIAHPDLIADVKEGQIEGVAEFQHAGSLSKHKVSTSQNEQTVKDELEPCTIAAESVSSFAAVTVSNDILQYSLKAIPEDNPESSPQNTAMTGNKFQDSSLQPKLSSSPKVDSRKKLEVQNPRLVSAVEESCSEVVTSHFDYKEEKKASENESKDLSCIANIPSEENTSKSLEVSIVDNLFHCTTYDDINATRDAVTSEIDSPTNALGCIAQLNMTADVKEGQSEQVAEFQHAGSLSKHKGSTSQDEHTVKDEWEPCTILAESVSSFAAVTVSNDLLQDTLDDIPTDNLESFLQTTAMNGNKLEELSLQPKLASSPKVDSRKKMQVQSPQLLSAVEESCSVVTSHFDHEEQKKVIENESKDLSCISNIPSEENTPKSMEGLIGDSLFHCKTYGDINVTRDAGTSEINSSTNALGCIDQLDMTADVKEGLSEGVAELQHAGSLSRHKGSTSQDEQTVKDEQELCTIAAEGVSNFATVIVSNDLLLERLDHGPVEDLEDGCIQFEDAGLVHSSEKHDYDVSVLEDHAVDVGNQENINTVYLSTTERFSPVLDKEHANDVFEKKTVELGEQLSSISRKNIEHAFAKGDRIPKEEDLVGQVNGLDNDEKPLEYSGTDRRGETILRVTCIIGEEDGVAGEEIILPSTTSAASCECIGSFDGLKQEVQEKDLHGNTDRDESSKFVEPSGSHDNFPCLLSPPSKHKCEVGEEKDADTVGRENNSDDAFSNLEVDYSLEASHEVCEEPNIRREAVLPPWGSFHGDISRELNTSTAEKRIEEYYTVKSSTSIFPCAERPDAEPATLSSPKTDMTLGGNTEGQKLQVENTSTTSTSNYIEKEDTEGCPTAMANDAITSPSKLLSGFEEIDISAPISDELCSKSNKCTSADEDSHGTTTTSDHPLTVADLCQPWPCQLVEPEASNSPPPHANESSGTSATAKPENRWPPKDQ